MRLRALAPAKVNLGLFVGARRANGRHGLATIYESVSLADELIAETLPAGAADIVSCAGVTGENLVATALAALRASGWDGPALRITVHKSIPVAAGMGGGSADAAAALRLALALAPWPERQLAAIAAALGADVPGQLAPGVSLGGGEGEIVTRCGPLAEHAFVVVPSQSSLSTAAVYGCHDQLALGRDELALHGRYDALAAALSSREPARLAGALLANDLQRPAIELCPDIAGTLRAVREAGADQALVSGSGPTVLGIWWGAGALAQAQTAAATLRAGLPGTLVCTPVAASFGQPGTL